MVHRLKHYAVRSWLAVLLGGGSGIAAVAVLQPGFGSAVEPVALALWITGLFAALGPIMNRIGLGRFGRRTAGASAAERQGRRVAAERELRDALAALDSFLVSPRARRRRLPTAAGRLARFYLGRGLGAARAEAFVRAYLDSFPGDEEAAELWATQLRCGAEASASDEELAQKIGAAHPRNRVIQTGLARFYLALERTDFAALQTYRFLWASHFPPELAAALADLLRREGRRDAWSREVLQAVGRQTPAEPGPAAAPPPAAAAAEARPAQRLERVERLPEEHEHEPWAPFRIRLDADEEGAGEDLSATRGGRRRFTAAAAAGRLWAATGRRWAGRAVELLAAGLRGRPAFSRRALWRAAAITAVGGAALVVGLRLVGRPPENPAAPVAAPQASAPPAEPAPAPVTGPFTLQVAAYLRPEYAVKFVEELRARGLDAYWTETASGDKRWYQVRIAHFPDAAAARDFGRRLKQQGVVEDFYVANTGR